MAAVLVTGGAGYIGSHTARRLRALGREVVVLDSLERGRAEAVIDAPLVVGDIADRELVTSVVREYGVESAVHFAAYKAVAESMLDPGRYFANNVTGSHRLIDALHGAGVDRIVFSSTCAVYGTAEVVPVSEHAPLHPESVYAETKRMIEDLLRWYSVCHGVRSVSLRYFNAAGASADGVIGEDWSDSQNLVPVAMKAALGLRSPLQVFGDDYPTPDGTAVRDYIHVEDLAEAHVKALDHLERGGETIALNVGTGTGTSVRAVLEAIERVSGRPVPHDIVGRRAGDPVALYSDNSLVRTTLGWEPSRGLDEIIGSAWNWHSALAAR
ncbi:MAG TPA: UDP-glucose 4-epimerase GalE [Acidimicrobiales bacterium]|jgi:UDP-glucose-4-epimerase GalE|nr:UDP-glucose 4-epimerase GalE [Acidimicrobiales bacterium]